MWCPFLGSLVGETWMSDLYQLLQLSVILAPEERAESKLPIPSMKNKTCP